MDIKLPKILVIVGPTASGKTALALELARQHGGEIVNADSRQVYRGMDIATAKPPALMLRSMGVPHHCFDLVEPDQEFSVAGYQACAFAALDDILARGKLPILVGGTGLYVRAVLENLRLPEVPPNPELRAELETKTTEELFARIREQDPVTAAVIQRTNKRRLIRALEVIHGSGKSFTEAGAIGPAKYQALILGLNPPKEILKQRIAERIESMLAQGLLAETKNFATRFSRSRKTCLSAFSSLGYPEMVEHLEGRLTLDEAKKLLAKNTLDYARRQLTYFKKLPVVWVKDAPESEKVLTPFLAS